MTLGLYDMDLLLLRRPLVSLFLLLLLVIVIGFGLAFRVS